MKAAEPWRQPARGERRSGGDGQPFLLPAQLQRFGRGGDFHQQFAQRGGKSAGHRA